MTTQQRVGPGLRGARGMRSQSTTGPGSSPRCYGRYSTDSTLWQALYWQAPKISRRGEHQHRRQKLMLQYETAREQLERERQVQRGCREDTSCPGGQLSRNTLHTSRRESARTAELTVFPHLSSLPFLWSTESQWFWYSQNEPKPCERPPSARVGSAPRRTPWSVSLLSRFYSRLPSWRW